MLRRVIMVGALMVVKVTPAAASPQVDLEDPAYVELSQLGARGLLPPATGGLRPLTEARMQELLARVVKVPAQEVLRVPARPLRGPWGRPLDRVTGWLSLFHEHPRPYSTGYRPRDLVGAVAVSCEHTEGRPCGDGFGLIGELDSAAGYGPWVSAFTRVRASAGTSSYQAEVALDRGYVNAELGPVALEVGRDGLVLGPSARTQVIWGDHAPPLDQVRVSTSRPLDLVGRDGGVLRASLLYVVGRLRAPQTYPGNLVTIARGQLDIADQVELGMSQLLQLGGEGAPALGVWDFVAEHFRRGDMSASESDSSNRRVSFDVAVRVERLCGARLYYEVAFEDWRRQFDDALRFDADHLLGVELAAIGPGRRHGLVVEVQKTGLRSHEHSPRVTGLTNAGRVVGSPLGPDAQSLYGGGRIEVGKYWLSPWVEVARLSSDTYQLVPGVGIWREAEGIDEWRFRAGAGLRIPLAPGLRVDVDAVFEHVAAADFVPGARRENFGGAAVLVWRPGSAATLGVSPAPGVGPVAPD